MPQDPNKRKQLYGALQSSGFQLPDYEKFEAGLNDPNMRKRLYESLRQNEFQLPEYSVFDSQLGGIPQQQPQRERPLYRRINEQATAPLNLMGKGSQQIGRGNYAAGVQNLMAGGLSAPFAPIGVATELAGEIPVVGPTIKEGLQGLASIPPWLFNVGRGGIQEGLNLLGFTPDKERQVLGQTPQQYGETQEATQTLGDVGSYFAIPALTKATGSKLGPATRRFGERIREASAEKIGGAIGAGESVPMMRRAGQFMAEEKIPVGVRQSTTKRGALMASEKASQLNQALNEKILDPATKSGSLVDVRTVLNPLKEIRRQLAEALPPDRAGVRALDQMINDAQARMKSGETPGFLTPNDAQNLKVQNNQILSRYYEKVERVGESLENMKKRGRAEVNSELRRAIEELDPQIKGINWTEGAALEVSKALEQFYEARLRRDPAWIRGSGITGAAAGRGSSVGLYAITELFAFRPFRVKYNKMVNQIGRVLSRMESEFTRPGDIRPFRPGTPFVPPPAGVPIAPSGPIGDIIPPFFRKKIINDLGGADKLTKFGELKKVSDRDLITLAKEAGLYENAPLSEAPVSRGGSMDVRGPANQEQIRRGGR